MEMRAGIKTEDVSTDAPEMSWLLKGTTVYHTNVLGDGYVSTNDVVGVPPTVDKTESDTSLINVTLPRRSLRYICTSAYVPVYATVLETDEMADR